MENHYEEYYPDKIAYSTYERDIEEKEREISNLQDEIYEKDKRIEELENELKEIKRV